MQESGKNKICFISPKAYPLFNPSIKSVFGGAELDFYLLAKELAKDRNFQVSFITADYGQRKFENVDGVSIIKTLDFSRNSLVGAIKLWRGFKKADARIYLQKTASWGTFLTALFCRLHKKVFIYRTASQEECDGTYIKKFPIQGLFFKWALKTAKIVAAQNESDSRKLKEVLGIDSIVIPNGHPIPQIIPDYKERNSILWVGRSAQVKRPEIFIDIAQAIPKEQFIMICQRATGDKNYDLLKSKASKVKNLQFIDQVPFPEIEKYFQASKVFVNTSDTEGFPNTFIQACCTGVPILSLNVNPDGFLDKYKCGICVKGNISQMTLNLEKLLTDDINLDYGRNALKYVRENHDIRKISDEYKKFFII
ncbi:MAG: glycosyltransferase family 4 protein [Phycisphaerae bacterium]